jgi:hypothetical protein
MRLLVLAVVVCASSGGAWATEDEEQVLLVGPTRTECNRYGLGDVQWTIKGDVEVGEVLHVLARMTCERFLVTRDLMHQRVNLQVSNEKVPAREMRSRVVGALRANGIAVDMDMSYRVSKSSGEPDPFSSHSLPLPSPSPSPILTQSIPEAELDKGITCSGNRCELSRALFDRILGDSTGMSRGARIVPSVKDGQPNGMKLYAIRPKSYFGRLGLTNGDTITAVNGMDINSPDKALEAYAKIRTAKKLTLSLIRRGEPVTQEIVIK